MAASLICRRILLNKNKICKIPKRHGYIVLLPEIGDDMPEKNPLLKEETKLPEFNKFTIEKCIAAIGRQAVEMEQGVRNLEEKIKGMKDEEIFEKLINPLEELIAPLEITWGISKTLYLGNQTLMPTRLFNNIQRRATKGRLFVYQSKPIFEACKKAYNNNDLKLTQEERQMLYKFLLEGRLSGLDAKDKEQVDYNMNEIQKDQMDFRTKIDGASRNYKRSVSDPHIVKDFPENFLSIIARDPLEPHQGPWTINNNPHVISKFLEYCPDPFLRFKVWEDSVTLCSMEGEKSFQTSQNIEGIRINRQLVAETLGFKNYVEMSMETKMAENVENVNSVFQTLYETARPCQEEEISNLAKFAQERGFKGELGEWDIPYWGRKQLRTNYQFENEALREYFPLSNVLEGLYSICEKMFNIKIVEERKVDTWHKDVRFFDVFDLNNSSTEPISSFYLDPYSRSEHKQMIPGSTSTIKYKSTINGDKPLVAMIFNFQPPTPERESLLTFKDVSDLFQKFGYALRILLAKTNYHATAEIIEWDGYAITGYFLENSLYEKSTIKKIAKHYQNGELLPDEIINKLIDIRSNLAGYKLCKEMYLSEFDLQLHSTKEFWLPKSRQLWKKYFVIPMHKSNEHICSFVDIFLGGWGAAYYSSLWSKMCAADAYSTFHEVAANDEKLKQEIGQRFRDTFLTYGGSYPMSEVFRQFRGRDPSPLAILKSLNLKMPEPETNKVKVESDLKVDLIK